MVRAGTQGLILAARDTGYTLFGVIAPLMGVLEAASYLAQGAVHSAGSELEKNILRTIPAAFWDSTQVVYDGQLMDKSLVKYHNASWWQVPLIAYSAGLFGTNEKDGTLKVGSWREVPNNPKDLVMTIDKQSLLFAGALTGLRWATPALQNIQKGDFGRKFKAFNEAFDKTFVLRSLRSPLGAGTGIGTQSNSRLAGWMRMAVNGTAEEMGEQVAQFGINLVPVSPILQAVGVPLETARNIGEFFQEVSQEIILQGLPGRGMHLQKRWMSAGLIEHFKALTGEKYERIQEALRNYSRQPNSEIKEKEVEDILSGYRESGLLNYNGFTLRGIVTLTLASTINSPGEYLQQQIEQSETEITSQQPQLLPVINSIKQSVSENRNVTALEAANIALGLSGLSSGVSSAVSNQLKSSDLNEKMLQGVSLAEIMRFGHSWRQDAQDLETFFIENKRGLVENDTAWHYGALTDSGRHYLLKSIIMHPKGIDRGLEISAAAGRRLAWREFAA